MNGEAAVPDELLTGKELALKLRMHPETVNVMARKGDIPAVRIGKKRMRFDWLDVIRHLKGVGASQPKGVA